MTNPDRQIIREILAGDVDRFARLVKRHQGEVAMVVNAMMFSRDECNDLIQKTFVNAFAKLEQFDLNRDFGLWLKGIARNTVRMHLRRIQTARKYLDVYRGWLEAQRSTWPVSHETAQQEALRRCLRELPENGRQLIDLRYHKGDSIGMIADCLGRSVDAVTKSLSRLRASLRDCVKRRLEQ